jgi:hypothetical protein
MVHRHMPVGLWSILIVSIRAIRGFFQRTH